jgi:hypothetical protein
MNACRAQGEANSTPIYTYFTYSKCTAEIRSSRKLHGFIVFVETDRFGRVYREVLNSTVKQGDALYSLL